MQYTEFFTTKSIEDFLKELLNTDARDGVITVKSVEVSDDLSKESLVNKKVPHDYKVDINFEVISHEGDSVIDSKSISVTFPKLVDNVFMMKDSSGKDKFRSPINTARISRNIREFDGVIHANIFSLFVGSIEYSGEDSKIHPAYLDVAGQKYDLEGYLQFLGADASDISSRVKYGSVSNEDGVDYPDIKSIPGFKDKLEQLTGYILPTEDLNYQAMFALMDLFHEDKHKFRTVTPIDLNYKSEIDGLISHLNREKWTIRRTLVHGYNRYATFSPNTLQSLIKQFFNFNSRTEQSIQSASDSSAASVLSQSMKFYITDSNGRTDLKFSDDFVGVVDPAKTHEGNLVNVRNELSRDVRIVGGEVSLKVLDKNGESVLLKYMDYYRSRVLSITNYDYERKSLVPSRDGSITVLHRGKYISVESSEDSYDYIRRDESSLLTYNSAMIPFMNKTDSVRVAMGSSMMDQAIPVIGSKPPIVKTGVESEVFEESDFNTRSEVDGTVSEIIDGFVKIVDHEGNDHIYQIPDSMETAYHTNNQFSALSKVGDPVSKGDVIISSNSFKDGQLSLTVPMKIAYMSYEGFDFEDGIVMRQSSSKKFGHEIKKDIQSFISKDSEVLIGRDLLVENGNLNDKEMASVEDLNVYGLPEIGQVVKADDTLFGYLEKIDPSTNQYKKLMFLLSGDKDSSFYEKRLTKVPFNIPQAVVKDVQIVIDQKEDDLDFKEINKYYLEVHKSRQSELSEFFGKEDEAVMANTIQDLPSERMVVKITLEYINYPKVGDKFCNRFGSKGTICALVPDNEMPTTNEGDIDIIMSPESVVSRKNVSQTFETLLGNVAYASKAKGTDLLGKGDFDEMRKMLNLVHQTDRFTEYSDFDITKYNEDNDEYYPIKVGPLDIRYTEKVLREITEYLGMSLDGKTKVYLPTYDKWVKTPIVVGMTNIMRLHFLVEEKAKATSDVSLNDTFVLGQGYHRPGGQKIGGMEFWAIAGHGNAELVDHLSQGSDKKRRDSVIGDMLLLGTTLSFRDDD